jgi:hypothetical protein
MEKLIYLHAHVLTHIHLSEYEHICVIYSYTEDEFENDKSRIIKNSKLCLTERQAVNGQDESPEFVKEMKVTLLFV